MIYSRELQGIHTVKNKHFLRTDIFSVFILYSFFFFFLSQTAIGV